MSYHTPKLESHTHCPQCVVHKYNIRGKENQSEKGKASPNLTSKIPILSITTRVYPSSENKDDKSNCC